MLGHTSMHARNYAKPQVGDLVKIGSLDARAVVWVQEAHDTGEVMLVMPVPESPKSDLFDRFTQANISIPDDYIWVLRKERIYLINIRYLEIVSKCTKTMTN